jgi:hypothetical protein
MPSMQNSFDVRVAEVDDDDFFCREKKKEIKKDFFFFSFAISNISTGQKISGADIQLDSTKRDKVGRRRK